MQMLSVAYWTLYSSVARCRCCKYYFLQEAVKIVSLFTIALLIPMQPFQAVPHLNPRSHHSFAVRAPTPGSFLKRRLVALPTAPSYGSRCPDFAPELYTWASALHSNRACYTLTYIPHIH